MEGTKTGFGSGAEQIAPKDTHRRLERQIADGEYTPYRPFDLGAEGGLLEGPDGTLYYAPPAHMRGTDHLKPVRLHGTTPDVKPDNEKTYGVEIEQWMVDPETGEPQPVREYDHGHPDAEPQTGQVRLYQASAITPEFATDLDERDVGMMPYNKLGQRVAEDVVRNVQAFASEGVAVSPFAITPHEITPDRIDKHPYIQALAAKDEHYAKFFNGAGLQLHRAIRRNCETREEAAEFAAFASNRMDAYSWVFQVLSGASPNIAGVDVAEHYSTSERFSDEDKQELRRLCGQTAVIGHSLRTLGRYAGSQSGGIPRKPLPESADGLFTAMHEGLVTGSVSNPARIRGEHADTRLRFDIGKQSGTGTFETSVPDSNFRAERVSTVAEVYDVLFDQMHETYKSGDNRLIAGSELIGSGTRITEEDNQRFRFNSFAASIHGPDAQITLADGSRRRAGDMLQDMFATDVSFDKQARKEIMIATSIPSPESLTKDATGLPGFENYFEGRAPSLPYVFAERLKASEYKGRDIDDVRKDAIVYGSAALLAYAQSIGRINQGAITHARSA